MTFQVRPHKARVLASAGGAVLIVAFTVVGVLLRNGATGVTFYVSDQVAMIGIGVLLAAGLVFFFARPRVRADTDGVEVRNVLGTQHYPWSAVQQVTFPDGSPWARLELPEDEYVPVMAVQAIDGEQAVAAMRELRRLQREARIEPEST